MQVAAAKVRQMSTKLYNIISIEPEDINNRTTFERNRILMQKFKRQVKISSKIYNFDP